MNTRAASRPAAAGRRGMGAQPAMLFQREVRASSVRAGWRPDRSTAAPQPTRCRSAAVLPMLYIDHPCSPASVGLRARAQGPLRRWAWPAVAPSRPQRRGLPCQTPTGSSATCMDGEARRASLAVRACRPKPGAALRACCHLAYAQRSDRRCLPAARGGCSPQRAGGGAAGGALMAAVAAARMDAPWPRQEPCSGRAASPQPWPVPGRL